MDSLIHDGCLVRKDRKKGEISLLLIGQHVQKVTGYAVSLTEKSLQPDKAAYARLNKLREGPGCLQGRVHHQQQRARRQTQVPQRPASADHQWQHEHRQINSLSRIDKAEHVQENSDLLRPSPAFSNDPTAGERSRFCPLQKRYREARGP